jgi:hypothetical protein
LLDVGRRQTARCNRPRAVITGSRGPRCDIHGLQATAIA